MIIPPFLCLPGDERMPLGAAYLSSVLKEKKISVNCIDTRFEQVSFDCEFMGITVFTQTFSYVKALVKIAKEKGIKTIAGGPHCKADPISLIRIGFDAVVVGEGERILPDLIGSFKKGIYYTDPILDLDTIPLPDTELLNKYPYRKDTAWILTSRGCPNKCSYCQQFFGNTLRLRTVGNILSEVERYGNKMIEIIDDCFTVNKERVFNFCKCMPKLKYRLLTLSNGTIVTTLNKEIIAALAMARLAIIMIGQESIDREVIKLANRRVYREDSEEIIECCKKNNIKIGVFMMVGLPGSSYKSDLEGIEWIFSQKVSANYGVPVPFKNTELWSWVEKNAKWLNNPYEYEIYPPKFEMENYKAEKIDSVFKLANKLTHRQP